jgi:hypothetical protein
VLLQDEGETVRANAAEALGSIGGPRAKAALKSATMDKSTFVAGIVRDGLYALKWDTIPFDVLPYQFRKQ